MTQDVRLVFTTCRPGRQHRRIVEDLPVWGQGTIRAASGRSPEFRRGARPSVSLGLPITLILDGSHERREINPETMRYPVEILKSDVAETALDPGDIGHVQPCPVREILLRQVARDPQVPDRGSESDEQRSANGGHRPTLLSTQTIRP